jgi:hypothetical protein
MVGDGMKLTNFLTIILAFTTKTDLQRRRPRLHRNPLSGSQAFLSAVSNHSAICKYLKRRIIPLTVPA